MGRFLFRLETLLKLRKSARQQRRLALAQAYKAADLLRQQMEFLAEEQTETRKRSQVAVSPGVVKVDHLLDSHRYAILLLAQAQQMQRQQEQLQQEIERRRQALVEADREVRVLEKLREKQQAKHRHEESRREFKELDEIAQRHVRQSEP